MGEIGQNGFAFVPDPLNYELRAQSTEKQAAGLHKAIF